MKKGKKIDLKKSEKLFEHKNLALRLWTYLGKNCIQNL